MCGPRVNGMLPADSVCHASQPPVSGSAIGPVRFDVGFVRVGRHVAQVTFLPAGRAAMRDGDFRDLLVRAGQRLAELD